MTQEIIEQLETVLEKEQIRQDEPMKKHITFRVGGPADIFVTPSAEQLADVLFVCRKNHVPVTVIGNGSNLLVGDRGIRGVVVNIGRGMQEIRTEGEHIFLEAGATLAAVSMQAANAGLTGLEFASGIPGTFGGAVVMNAGAYGGEIKDIIVSATVLTAEGDIMEVSAEDMELSYRHSAFQQNGSTVLSASFKLAEGDYDSIKAKMNELMDKRRSKQPLEYASAGSTFKRPEGSFASLLIDQCGLKGMSVGDAEVSTKHSGFIVNKGNASFDELMELIGKVKAEVLAKTGYELECEPIIISDREEYSK